MVYFLGVAGLFGPFSNLGLRYPFRFLLYLKKQKGGLVTMVTTEEPVDGLLGMLVGND